MRIYFKLRDDSNIDIIGVQNGKEQLIGAIFTPSGSGKSTANAIQVCGFSQAFDLWGCSRFQILKDVRNLDNDIIKRDKYGDLFMQQAKDIQLLFESETQPSPDDIKTTEQMFHSCPYCFNEPCTCEVRIKYENPYTVKREQDLPIQNIKDVVVNGLK